MTSHIFLKQKIKTLLEVAIMLFFLSLPLTAHAGLCDDISKSTKGFFSCGQETTTFTEFQGGLTAPETAGYNKGLTQATNVRDYIKNVVNFTLSFLGIIAVVVIIYGGFLYVTAAGSDEKAGKGKKSVTYAVIGLLIVMASFAIVNTVLQAPGGKESGGQLAGSAPGGGDQNTRRRALFNFAASVVQTVTRDFVTAYQNYAEINTDLANLENVDIASIKSLNELRAFLSDAKNKFTNIKSKAGGLSQVAEKSAQSIQAVDKYLQIRDKDLQEVASGKVKWEAFFDQPKIDELSNLRAGILKDFRKANGGDFALAVQQANTKIIDLRKRIKQAALLREVDLQFVVVLNDFRKLVDSLPSVEPALGWLLRTAFAEVRYLELTGKADNTVILTIVENLSKLNDLVKDIQFVYTVINADVTEGNAPLVINFDGLKSLDPNNKTIPEANFKWDFGDSQTAEKVVTPTHIYDKSGTYIVKLEIKAPDSVPGEQKAADGVAFRTVIVKPPASRIKLKVASDETFSADKTFIISDYNDEGFQVVNVSDITFTTAEAKNGIWFDATRTATGGGKLLSSLNTSPTVKIKWDFGDKSKKDNLKEGKADLLGQKTRFIYDKEGIYRVTFEVTDDRGITDRKIFNIVVSSIAARIRVSPGTVIDKSTKVMVDGSASATNLGTIRSYKWEFSKLPSLDFTKPAETVDHFDIARFTLPGIYDVSLEVADNSNKTAKTSVSLSVSAKSPVAKFTIANKDKTHPNVFIVDGSGSYSPDATADEKIEYKWEINAAPGDCGYYAPAADGKNFNNDQKDCSELGKEGDKGWSGQNGRLKLKMKKGKYMLALVARNVADVSGSKGGKVQEQELNVDRDLDVGWGDDGKSLTAKLDDSGKAEIIFSIKSENGVAYEIDTGDSAKEKGKMSTDAAVATTVKHVYDKAGLFTTKLIVFDAQDNSNSISRKVFVGAGDKPIAAINASQDGSGVSAGADTIVGNRKTVFVFDADKSLNVDGTGRRLTYSWDLGDGEKSTKKQVTHIYREANLKSDDAYIVKLKVSSDENPAKFAEDSVKIQIRMEPPLIRALTVVPESQKLVTPVTVNVSAIGTDDPDGKIVSYRWWYYDVNNPENLLGLQITQSPFATLTIGTIGEEAQKKIYKFGVAVTDNDNMTFDTSKDFNEAQLPAIEVTNGPNKGPVAKFSVDRTSINAGESVNFTSSSFDPDAAGGIIKYIWDFEGKGFGVALLSDEYNKSNVAYTYAKPAKNGYRAKLKVVDNNGAEAVSDAVTIYVEGQSNPPVAAFVSKQVGESKKVQFTDNSKADTANGATINKWTWDFDVNSDSDGDGVKNNDKDSVEQNPSWEYREFGIYRAKLTVEDDQGNVASITNFVNLKKPVQSPAANLKSAGPAAAGLSAKMTQTQAAGAVGTGAAAKPVEKETAAKSLLPAAEFAAVPPPGPPQIEKLEARLLTIPPASEADGRVHLQGDSATVIFNFANSKGDIKAYIIDKNVFFDSDGNGVKDDDEDYKSTAPGTWTTQYFRSYGAIRVRLTVVDAKGKKAFVDKDIVFDTPAPAPGKKPKNPLQLQTSVLSAYGVVDLSVVLVSLVGFAIFTLSVFYAKRKSSNTDI